MNYRVSELSPSLLEQITSLIGKFSTTLIHLIERPNKRAEAQIIGSGTFATIGGISGIITAQHVANLIEPSTKIGLILAEEEHRFTIEGQHITAINLIDALVPGNGPDLSFLRLPPYIVSQIKPYRSFYDLSVDRQDILTRPPPHHAGAWFVCGTPDETTKIETSQSGFGQVLSLFGLCGVGGPSSEYEEEGFDYIEVDVEYKDSEYIPTTFGGISGGGLWQVILKGDSVDQLQPSRYLFYGIPFYQSQLADRKRTIKCHGRKSIYGALFSSVVSKYSQP